MKTKAENNQSLTRTVLYILWQKKSQVTKTKRNTGDCVCLFSYLFTLVAATMVAVWRWIELER